MTRQVKLKREKDGKVVWDDLVMHSRSMLLHEIRNPLSVLAGIVGILPKIIQRDRGQIEPEVSRLLEMCKSEIARISSLVERFVRPVSTKRSRRKLIDLNRLIERAIANLRYIKTDLLLLDLDERLPRIRADEQELEFVMQALISNALDAVAANQGEVHARTCIDEISGDVRIIVSDSGPGIRKQDIDRIFDPFFSTKKKGMGFGLYLARELVYLHQGSIRCTSKLAKGSTFEVRLPMMRESK